MKKTKIFKFPHIKKNNSLMMMQGQDKSTEETSHQIFSDLC